MPDDISELEEKAIDKMKERLKGRRPIPDNPDCDLCEHYPEPQGEEHADKN